MRANSSFQFMLKTALHLGLFSLLCMGLPCLAASQAIQVIQTDIQPSLETLATDFVRQMVSRAGSLAAVSVSFQNISVLPPESQEAVQNAIFTGFRNAGVRLANAEGAQARVDITFSEDWRGFLWIATIDVNGNKKVVMKKVARPEHTTNARAPMLTIRKSAVWQQDTPILDFYQDNQTLALLQPDVISIFANDSGVWRPRYTLAITHPQPWPRDLRGRLVVKNSQ